MKCKCKVADDSLPGPVHFKGCSLWKPLDAIYIIRKQKEREAQEVTG